MSALLKNQSRLACLNRPNMLHGPRLTALPGGWPKLHAAQSFYLVVVGLPVCAPRVQQQMPMDEAIADWEFRYATPRCQTHCTNRLLSSALPLMLKISCCSGCYM